MSKGPSRASRALRGLIKAKGIKQAAIRRQLGCASGMVSHWLKGDRKPGLEWAAAIEREFGIPVADWTIGA